MNEKELMEQSQKQVFFKDIKKQAATIDLNSNQLYTAEEKKYIDQKKKMEIREDKQIRKNERPYNPNSCCNGDPCGDCCCDAETCDLIICILCCPIMIFD